MCVRAFLNRGDQAAAFRAVSAIEFWRMQEYINIAPMDSSDFGTHEYLFRTAACHGGGLVMIARHGAIAVTGDLSRHD